MSSEGDSKMSSPAPPPENDTVSPQPSIQRKRTPSSKKKSQMNSEADVVPAAVASESSSAVVCVEMMDGSTAATTTTTPSKKSKKKKPPSSVLETATGTTTTTDTPTKKPKRTFNEMIVEAIRALKDRTGSSQIAIQKYILSEWTDIVDNPTFRSRMGQTLKKGIKSGQFQRIKASYKISAEWTKKERQRKSKDASKKLAEKKKRDQASQQKRNEKEAQRIEDLKKTLSPEELEELRVKHEAKMEKQRAKEEVIRKAKEKAERLRRRRFPMEDTRLHLEDKELGLAPPKGVKRRPVLPHFFQLVRPDNKNSASSKCDAMDYDNRGLVPDTLQVYHFFRGDVRFCDLLEQKLVADFTLSHLMHAIDEVLMGNAKKSKMIPPLLTHLFCVCLSLLTNPVSDGNESREQAQLHKDLRELGQALNPASWPEVCALYMDCMHRYYSGTQDAAVLPPGKTDVEFLFRVTDKPDLSSSSETTEIDGFNGYFGSLKSTLVRGVDRLNKQDPWTLPAEDLMAMLRALTDDILSSRPDLMVEMTAREEELAELAKLKRNADSSFRKIKFAYEGPQQKAKPAAPKKEEESKDSKDEKEEDSKDSKSKSKKKGDSNGKEKEWKQTATKKQFEQARREQNRANEAYQEGLKKLVARTEPFGYDRHFNRYFFCLNDPDFIFVESTRSASGIAEELPEDLQIRRTIWHGMDKVSTMEQLDASLDVRGHREKALHDAMFGTEDAPNKCLKRFLYDDVKAKAQAVARKEQREELQKEYEKLRLHALRLEEEGVRRPSRSQKDPVAQMEQKIENLDKRIAKDEADYEPDYFRLTGVEILRKFDGKTKRKTRKGSEVVGPMPSTSLLPTGSKLSGVVGCLVDEIFVVEQLCQDLVPWEEENQRNQWTENLQSLSEMWNIATPLFLGPEPKDNTSDGGVLAAGASATPDGRLSIGSVDSRMSIDGAKRRKIDSPGASSQAGLNQIINQLKRPLLDLEERIYEVSGLAMADRDQIIADDNMSAGEEEEDTEEDQERERYKILVAWRKKVHAIRSTPAKRPSHIREQLVQAIAAARKAHLGNIVSKLRSALLLYHSDAAGDCKQAAIAVLDEEGGYEPNDDDDDDEDEDAKMEGEEKESAEQHVQSNLCFEAMSLLGSLGDDDQATRVEWREAVQQCRTISRLAALTTAFCSKATERMEKFISERQSLEKALDRWQKEEDRKKRAGNKKNNRKVVEQSTEMWANVDFTNNFCMVRLEGHPWWPAKKCVAKDGALQSSLQSFDRVLVSMVGEHGELRCVKNEDMQKFTGKSLDENLDEFSKKDRSQLEDCLAIARRILRGQKPQKGDQEFIEEKKTAF